MSTWSILLIWCFTCCLFQSYEGAWRSQCDCEKQMSIKCAKGEVFALKQAKHGRNSSCARNSCKTVDTCCKQVHSDCRQTYNASEISGIQAQCSKKRSCQMPNAERIRFKNATCGISENYAVEYQCIRKSLIVNMCTKSRKSGKDLHLFYSPKKYQGNITCRCSVDFMPDAAVRAIDVRVTSRYLHQVALFIGAIQLQSINGLYGFKTIFTLPSTGPVDISLRSDNVTFINKIWLTITGNSTIACSRPLLLTQQHIITPVNLINTQTETPTLVASTRSAMRNNTHTSSPYSTDVMQTAKTDDSASYDATALIGGATGSAATIVAVIVGALLCWRYRKPAIKSEENEYTSLDHSPMGDSLAAPGSVINTIPNDHIYALPDSRSSKVYNSNEPSGTMSPLNREVPLHGNAIKSLTDMTNMDIINYTIPSANERCLHDNNINQALDRNDCSSCVQEAENPIYDSMSMDSHLYTNTNVYKDRTNLDMYMETQLANEERYAYCTPDTMATDVQLGSDAKRTESNVLSPTEHLNNNCIAKQRATDAEYSEVFVEKSNLDPENAQTITDTGYFILEQPSSPSDSPVVQNEPEPSEVIKDAGYFVIAKCNNPQVLHVS